MQYIETLEALFFEAKAFFEKKNPIDNNIRVLEEALGLIGGENENITLAITKFKQEKAPFEKSICEAESKMKILIYDTFSEFFSILKDKFSFENFKFDESFYHKSRIPKIHFIEGEESAFTHKKLLINLGDSFSEVKIYLAKLTKTSDGRGGGGQSLLMEQLKDDKIVFKHGYYQTAEGPPFQRGYDYSDISEKEFLLQL